MPANTTIETRRAEGSFPPRIGIIGGGQLARMTAIAAMPMGCDIIVLDRTPANPAARLAMETIIGDWNDPKMLLELARRVDVVTLENEFVDAAALEAVEKAGFALFPSSASMRLTQDKFIQKQTLQQAGLAVPRFEAVGSREAIAAAGQRLGWPLVLKTRRNGYDGKGNFTLHSAEDINAGWEKLGGGKNELMVEAFWRFTMELAVMVTRGRNGETVSYPVVETIQRNHVCNVVKAPAAVSSKIATQAEAMAQSAVAAMGGIGTFGVEMFLSAQDEIVINELAPRVHNSGHYTIEACACSQFENHVRAVLGWPLGSPKMNAPAAVMLNLLGTESAPGEPVGWKEALSVPGAHVHLYGKASSSPGRKMGHVTALGATMADALATAERAAKQIYFGTKP